MEILLSNDDGVNAPGLAAHASVLAELGNIHVVAPEGDRSAFSHALTLEKPLAPRKIANGFISLNGTPADCVHLALNGMLGFTPDLVVAGINAGANLGDDVIYSGTVAAAMEGRFLNSLSIAVSVVGANPQYYDVAARITLNVIRQLPDLSIPAHTVLNINVPDLPAEQIKGIKVTRLGSRGPAEDVVEVINPRGRANYWIGAAGKEEDAGPGTDFYAVRQGFVSITPLHADMTDYKSIDSMGDWVNHF
ncbi:MAG: 5'/3'-nucleotidase SurE [Gammaproteobacteria bacterium]|nr:MAG: 5'/3'-nucleotidase SurE [Gammaproteobacteria bacterium]